MKVGAHMNLEDIKDPSFLQELSISEMQDLANDIRKFLIQSISETGGHFSSNLGVVELTIAMHRVFHSPYDKIIFDVGHQSYTHKILTGRAAEFSTLRKYNGLSGYLKRSESEHDIYEAGHSSTSLAAAAGIEFAKKYTGKNYKVVALIGDGALTSGMAFEALNFLGAHGDQQPIIILNDNEMSISKNIGYFSKVLGHIRTKAAYRTIKVGALKLVPRFLRKLTSKVERAVKGFLTDNTIFDDLGFQYFGPIDGHDIKELIRFLEAAKRSNRPCVVHVTTQKGKGYEYSENDQNGLWHGVSPFDIETGQVRAKEDTTSWSNVIGHYMMHIAESESEFGIVIPAMIAGSGLIEFEQRFPERIHDVGIAEQLSVTMASGLAIEGVKVFCPIYSTFLQRAYDQVNHDVARQSLNVVFGIDRAGIVGGDGETHQGVFDIPILRHLPNMTIIHPRTPKEAFQALNYAFYKKEDGPVAIRYERGSVKFDKNDAIPQELLSLKWETLREGRGPIFLAFGSILDQVLNHPKTQELDIMIVNARIIKPLDEKMIKSLLKENRHILVYEESSLLGGFGSSILEYLSVNGFETSKVHLMGLPDEYIQHGSKEEILKQYKMDVASVIAKLEEYAK